MPIIDRFNSYTDQANGTGYQSLSGVTTRTLSTNIVDLGANGDGYCHDNYLQIRANNAWTGTDGNCTFALETHTAADFSSARTVLSSVTVLRSVMAAGKVITIPLPKGMLRYSALVITCANATTGQLEARIADGIQQNNFIASAAGQG